MLVQAVNGDLPLELKDEGLGWFVDALTAALDYSAFYKYVLPLCAVFAGQILAATTFKVACSNRLMVRAASVGNSSSKADRK